MKERSEPDVFKYLIRDLRQIILAAIGEDYPPSVVFVACMDISAFAAKGIDIDKARFVETAGHVYKATVVPIEAQEGMQKHEREFQASGGIGNPADKDTN